METKRFCGDEGVVNTAGFGLAGRLLVGGC